MRVQLANRALADFISNLDFSDDSDSSSSSSEDYTSEQSPDQQDKAPGHSALESSAEGHKTDSPSHSSGKPETDPSSAKPKISKAEISPEESQRPEPEPEPEPPSSPPGNQGGDHEATNPSFGALSDSEGEENKDFTFSYQDFTLFEES